MAAYRVPHLANLTWRLSWYQSASIIFRNGRKFAAPAVRKSPFPFEASAAHERREDGVRPLRRGNVPYARCLAVFRLRLQDRLLRLVIESLRISCPVSNGRDASSGRPTP